MGGGRPLWWPGRCPQPCIPHPSPSSERRDSGLVRGPLPRSSILLTKLRECGGLRTQRSFSGGKARHLDNLRTHVMFSKTCRGRGPYWQFPGLVVNCFLSNLKKIPGKIKLTGPPDLQKPPPGVRLDLPEAEPPPFAPLYVPLHPRSDHRRRQSHWVPR